MFKIKKNIFKTKKNNSITVKQYQDGADFVDFILLHLEAGSNVEHSFLQGVNNLELGALKNNAEQINTFCRIGFSFGEALNHVLKKEMTDLVLKEILENFRLSLKLGSPLTKILNHLSFHFRLMAGSRLEELANEAPIKMIFPLVLFIFPVIFILLGSGAVENLIRSFNF